MDIHELLKKKDDLIKLRLRLEAALKNNEYPNKFEFGTFVFYNREIVEELRPMMEQYLTNTLTQLEQVESILKSINCLVSGAFPEKVKV